MNGMDSCSLGGLPWAIGEFAGNIYFGAAGLLFVEVSRLCYTKAQGFT